MSTWVVDDMAAALPETNTDAAPAASAPTQKNPQEHGWVAPTAYDYATYTKSSKELAEAQASFANQASEGESEDINAVGGLRQGDWANNAAVYEWSDEYGDVGPRHPELEKQLFGSVFHVRSGVQFET